MDEIRATDLKTILHSKRANLYYLEHCRVLVNGGRVEYVTDQGKQSLYWNICRIPSDHIPIRSWPLFLARELMRDLIETLKAEQST